jgi:hypothetical protein
MKFFDKVKKEVKVGYGTTLQAIGIKKAEENPDFLARDQTLRTISTAASNLLSQFETFAGALKNIGVATDTILSKLYVGVTIPPVVEGVTADQFTVNCIRPLQAFQERLVLLEAVKKKRHRNELLVGSTSGEEQARRREKYDALHRAFLRGVDIVAANWPILVGVIFGAEYVCLVQLARAARGFGQVQYPIYPPPVEVGLA